MELPRALEEELALGLKPVGQIGAARSVALLVDGVGAQRDVLVGWTPGISGRLPPR